MAGELVVQLPGAQLDLALVLEGAGVVLGVQVLEAVLEGAPVVAAPLGAQVPGAEVALL